MILYKKKVGDSHFDPQRDVFIFFCNEAMNTAVALVLQKTLQHANSDNVQFALYPYTRNLLYRSNKFLFSVKIVAMLKIYIHEYSRNFSQFFFNP